MGECRSEVFFTSPPNTKKGRSGCGRSVEMYNFKVSPFNNCYGDYYQQMAFHIHVHSKMTPIINSSHLAASSIVDEAQY